jgi:hypothetical protein
MKPWLWICALALAACSVAGTTPASSVSAAPAALPTHEWMRITPEPVIIDGRRIDPTCSHAPGTDPAFNFWARLGDPDKLVVYFDGGGACWDDITCSVPRRADNVGESDGLYKAELLPENDDPRRMRGIFDLNNARNPVRDWTIVFVPYCTGDVHSGANTAQYHDADTGEPFAIEHRGADNFRAVLAWMRANLHAPRQIFVTGSSAGAYGAATHYGRIRDAFPSGRAAFLGDAGQGVTTEGFLSQRNGNWRYDLPESVFGRDAQLTIDQDIVARLAAHYPRDRFAQYTTAHDITQIAFYSLMGVHNACPAWTEHMTSDLSRRQSAPNFRSYLAAGQTHTIMRSPLFYAQRSGGGPFAEWIGALVSDDGEGWGNQACQECQTDAGECPY